MEIKINEIDSTIDLGKNVLEGLEVKIPMENCVTCEHFDWWDGDYCCLKKMTILCSSNSDGRFTEKILENMKTPETCKYYDHHARPGYVELYEEFMKNREYSE